MSISTIHKAQSIRNIAQNLSGFPSYRPYPMPPKGVPSSRLATSNESKTQFSPTRPNLFGLVIGIDLYDSKDAALTGAVADAKAMEDFLRSNPAQAFSNIKTKSLFNDHAKRQEIIQALVDLEKDPDIKKGDAIIIFFAGHGGRMVFPDNWHAPGSKGECLIPHDHNREAEGGTVLPILDRILGLHIKAIAAKKGNNIVVILDCCHAGSGARDSDRKARGRDININSSDWEQLRREAAELEEKIPSMESDAQHHDRRSNPYVLLAACKSTESAIETKQRGLFTKRLIEVLKGKNTLTNSYASIIREVGPLDKQNPQCEGNQDFFFFTLTRDLHHRYVMTKSKGELTLKAGSVQGITEGDQFEIYETASSSQLLTTLECVDVNLTTAKLHFSDNELILEDADYYALQIRAGQEEKLKVYTSDEKFKRSLLCSSPSLGRITVVDAEHEAHMVLDKLGDEISFRNIYMLDKLGRISGISHLPSVAVTLPDKQREYSLAHASHYHWHLRRAPSNCTRRKLRDDVQIKYLQLRNPNSGELGMQPVDRNLIRDGMIVVKFDSEVGYGFEITTQLDEDIYPWVFYFDNHTFSIEKTYVPPDGGGQPEAPLRKDKALTIGYGASSDEPIFWTKGKQEVETGFFKVFLFKEWVSLENVAQRSISDLKTREYKRRVIIKPEMEWDAFEIPVVQSVDNMVVQDSAQGAADQSTAETHSPSDRPHGYTCGLSQLFPTTLFKNLLRS